MEARTSRIEARRVCVLVVGSHRSGTSALTRVLNIQGCDLPATIMGPNFGNKDGHWESEVIAAFDDQLLHSAGSRWDDIQPLGSGWYNSPLFADYFDKAKELLASEFGKSPLFILKDPRICRLGPFWLQVLQASGVEPAIVIPVRAPGEVGDSFERRDETPSWYAQLIWLRNVLDAEQATRGHNRVFTSFDRLRHDWRSQVDAIASGLDLHFPRVSPISANEVDRFINSAEPQLGTGAASRALGNRPEVSSWINDTYLIFDRWVWEGEKAEDHEVLDRIKLGFDQSVRALGAFLLPAVMAGEPGRGARRRQELQEQLATKENELAALQERAADGEASKDLRQQLDTVADEKAEALRSLAEIESNMAFQASHLRQREEEISQYLSELKLLKLAGAEARGRLEEVERERNRLAQAERQVTTGVERIIVAQDLPSETLAAFAEELCHKWDEAGHPLAALAGALTSLALSNAAFSGQKQTLHENVAALEEQIVSHKAAALEADQQATRALEQLDLKDAAFIEQMQALHEDVAALEEQIVNHKAAALEADRQAAASSALVASLRREAEQFRQEAAQARGQFRLKDDAYQRQALVQEALEEHLARRERDLDWMRRLHQQLEADESPWDALRSPHTRRKRLAKRLRHAGLFDADDYLARNADVGESGMDPLRHYLLHGMNEGRVIG